MAIQVDTRDCAALTDADLDEMASMGGAFDIGSVVEGQGRLGAVHHGPDRRQAARVHVLDARAHRRHAMRAARPDERQAHLASAIRC